MDTQTSRLLIELRNRIIQGTLPAGARLVEAALSESLKASRTPVRAALLMLHQEGLIERAGSSYVVRKFTATEIEEAIVVHAQLEGLAARLAAERGLSETMREQLQQCLEEGDALLREGCIDVARYLAMNVRFHDLIIDASGNRTIQQTLSGLECTPFASPGSMLPFQAKRPDNEEVMRYAHRQHHLLVDAISRRQSGRAAALAEEHRHIALRNLRQASAQAGEENVLPTLRQS